MELKEQLQSVIEETVRNTLTEIKAEIVNEVKNQIVTENKLYAPAGIYTQNNKDWMYKFVRGLKAIYNKDEAEFRQVTSSIGWLPIEFSDMVVQKAAELNPFRQFATKFNVESLKGRVPRNLAVITPQRVAEGSAYPSITPTGLDYVEFSIEKFGGYTPLTEELLKGSVVDVVENLASAIADGYAKLERNLFTNGTGTNQPKGFRSETYSNPITWNASAVYDTLNAAFMAVDYNYRFKGVWLTSTKGLQLIRGAKDSMGRPLFEEAQGDTPTLFGRRIYEIPEIPENLGAGSDETEIYFGDFSYYWIFDYNGGRLENDRNDILGWLSDVVYIKYRKSFDGKLTYFAEKVNIVKISGVK